LDLAPFGLRYTRLLVTAARSGALNANSQIQYSFLKGLRVRCAKPKA
jgi:hypothetical protein